MENNANKYPEKTSSHYAYNKLKGFLSQINFIVKLLLFVWHLFREFVSNSKLQNYRA